MKVYKKENETIVVNLQQIDKLTRNYKPDKFNYRILNY